MCGKFTCYAYYSCMYFGKLLIKRGHVVPLDGCIIAPGTMNKTMKIHFSFYPIFSAAQITRTWKVTPTERPRRNLARSLSVALDRLSAMIHCVTKFMPVFFLVVEMTDITRMASISPQS